MNKAFGILALLLLVGALTGILNPIFFSADNLQNLVRRTGLFGILSIGAALVIIAGGIDLSIGSVVGLIGALLPWLLVQRAWPVAAALPFVLATAAGIGALHGLLVTRLRLQPFVVTLCGLLIYRGAARWLTGDQTQGFGTDYADLRALAIGTPCSLACLVFCCGAVAAAWQALRHRHRRRPLALAASVLVAVAGGSVWLFEVEPLASVLAPAPFVILLGIAALAHVFLEHTVWGRHLLALGCNEVAARYSGIATGRLVVLAYVLCATCAGLGGVLFAADVNTVPPALHGNFYELYAIAAAVLGGCSLRGGEGTIVGVVCGAAVMRVLYNSINLLGIPTQLELAIVGLVLLCGVVADEAVKRFVHRSQSQRTPR